jgi:hypothetical protein
VSEISPIKEFPGIKSFDSNVELRKADDSVVIQTFEESMGPKHSDLEQKRQ